MVGLPLAGTASDGLLLVEDLLKIFVDATVACQN
jgi:hypothetical protein